MISLFSNDIELKYFILPIVYIIIGIIVYLLIQGFINHIFSSKRLLKKRHHQKRADTLRMMLLNIIKYIIVIFVVLSILTVFGIDIKSILAGIGITAAIIGLAFQDIAKDLLAGISIIIEDQYEVGDYIEINGFLGEVVGISLKTTRVRDYKGRTKIYANRSITEVINYNLSSNAAVVDISVAYEENNEKVDKILNKTIDNLNKTLPKLRGKVELLGIESLDDSAVIYRIIAPVSSMEQYKTERLIRKQIKEVFDKEKIKIPYPQVEVHNGK